MAPASKKPFKLLNLPFNAMEKVFRNMNKMDLIETSLTSKKAVKFIKLLRIFAEHYTVKYTKDLKTIILLLEDGHQLTWNFEKTIRFPMGIRTNQGVQYQYRRRLEAMYCTVDETCCTVDGKRGEDGDVMIGILEHLMSIFPGFVSDFHMQLSVDDSNRFIEHVAEQIGFCDTLLLSGDRNIKAIEDIMNNMKIGRRLEINQSLEEFQNSKLLEIPELIINQAQWIKPEALLSLRSSYAVLRNSNLTKDHIIEFLRAFQRQDTLGTAMGLWKIELMTGNTCTLAELEAAIPHFKYNKDIRDAKYSRFSDGKMEDCDARFGIDIIRDDGLLATVTITTGFVTVMNIIVWHDRRPNATHRKKYKATLSKTIDKYCQRNFAVVRNLRKMHEINQKIAELKLETEQLKAETAELRVKKSGLDEAREQFERVTGSYCSTSSEK